MSDAAATQTYGYAFAAASRVGQIETELEVHFIVQRRLANFTVGHIIHFGPTLLRALLAMILWKERERQLEKKCKRWSEYCGAFDSASNAGANDLPFAALFQT
jgi:hypothetical protein